MSLPGRLNWRAGSADVPALGAYKPGDRVRIVATARVVESWRKRDRRVAIVEIEQVERMEASDGC